MKAKNGFPASLLEKGAKPIFRNPKGTLSRQTGGVCGAIDPRPQRARATVPRASDQLTSSSRYSSPVRVRPMTQSAEDNARAILWIFSLEDVRAGHALMYEAFGLRDRKGVAEQRKHYDQIDQVWIR